MSDMPEWPKHPDGRNMKFGEMSHQQRREQFAASTKRVLSGMGATEIVVASSLSNLAAVDAALDDMKVPL